MGRRVVVLSLAVVVSAAAAPVAHAASVATLAGRLSGAKLPASGTGVVPMAAFRLTDGALVAGAYARPDGRFSLKTPPGRYAVLAALVPFRGRAKPIERVAAFALARPGKRSTLKTTLRKRRQKARRRARRSAARAAFVEVEYPAVGIFEFTTPPGDLAVLRRGLPDMLVTDLVSGIADADCDAVVVERMRLSDVIREQALQSNPAFDPSSRVPTGRLIAHNMAVNGSLTLAGGMMTIALKHTDLRTGRVRTVSQTGPADSVFDIEQALAPKLLQLVCPHTPKTYNATFNGTARSDFNAYSVRWSGAARVELTGRGAQPPDRWPAGSYAQYALKSGSVHAVLSGSRNGAYEGSCTVHGEADFTLPATPAPVVAVQLEQDTPAFFVALSGRGDEAIPYTETGEGCNQQNPQYPLAGVFFANTPDPLTAPGPASPLTANTSWDLGGAAHYSSQFTFTPAD